MAFYSVKIVVLTRAMSLCLLILILCSIRDITSATASVFDCPRMCDCLMSKIKLTVDCRGYDGNESTLALELDLLLSDDELRENLTLLNITNAPLTQIPMSICRLTNLRGLYLNDNRLSRLPDSCFTNMTSLRYLSASNNSITELQNGLFDGLNALTYLFLVNNIISSIGLHVFSNPNDLVSLKWIALDHNRLRSLEPWPYIRGLRGSQTSKIQVLISYNLIAEFTNNIEWQFNCSSPSYASVHIAYNYIRHIIDIVHGWNMTVDQWFCIRHSGYVIPSMEFQPLAFKVNYMYSYDYHCDCDDIKFYMDDKFVGFNRIFMNVKCSKPQNLANRYVNQVSLKEFVCEVSDRCPPSCRCDYRPANYTIDVYCSGANLTSLPLDLPPLPTKDHVYKLDFSNNRLLQSLHHRPYLVNASFLDVSNCAIDFIELNAWQQIAMMRSVIYDFDPDTVKLTSGVTPTHVIGARAVIPVVFLHGNKIESLSADVTDINLTSVHITLNDNPWKCSCDNRWIISWFQSLSSTDSSNVGDVLCKLPSRLEGRSIMKSDEVDFCVDPLRRMLKIVLSSTLSIVASLLIFGFAVYCLRVRLYKRWKFHPFDRDECIGEDMDYDVFFCCSSADDNPHGLHILQLMESKGYRVCYHERDFQPGLIVDNMFQSVLHSKRTVCFISHNFIQR